MGIIVLIILVGLGAHYVSKKWMNKKLTKFIIIGYVSILFFSFSIYELSLSKKLTLIEQSSIANAEKEMELFFLALNEGRLEEIDPIHIFEEIEVNYSFDQLMIEMARQVDDGVSIVVERKIDNDHKIEVIYFRTKPNVQGIDIMKDMKPIDLKWTNETLILTPPKSMEFNFALFKKEFPISQFNRNVDQFHVEPTYMMSNEVLYLRVPKDLEIVEGHEIYINYVGEE